MTYTIHGSLSTDAVLKSIASYLQVAEGLPLDYCLEMAQEILGIQHCEDVEMFVKAAKNQIEREGNWTYKVSVVHVSYEDLKSSFPIYAASLAEAWEKAHRMVGNWYRIVDID